MDKVSAGEGERLVWGVQNYSSVLQHARQGQFVAKCEAVGMRVSISESEAIVICWKAVFRLCEVECSEVYCSLHESMREGKVELM